MLFEIIDHRKSKNQTQSVNTYLFRIKTFFKPISIFGEVDEPNIEKVYYATNSIIKESIEIRSHSRQGISPTIKFDAENKTIRIFNSLNTLVVEIVQKENEVLIVIENFQREPQIFGYARVSTKKQNLSMQIEALKDFKCDEIIEEKASAVR